MSRQTFLDATCRQNQSGQPVFGTGTSTVCQDIMQQIGVGFPDAHLDAEKMAELAITAHTMLGFDVVMPLFSVCHEAAAMGCNVNWGDANAMPEAGPPIYQNADDIAIPANLIERPGCAVPVKAISLLKQRLGDDAAVCGKVFGPWTQSYHHFGLENFLIMTMDDPDQVRRILDKLVPVTVAFAGAQLDAGADCLLVADHATRDLCSPQAYEQFLVPLHTRLAQEIDAPLILHICGNTSDRIGHIAGTRLDCFHWDTKTGPAQSVRSLAGDKLSLMGGISNITLLQGSADEVAEQAITARKGDIDIIGPECAIPLATPLENLKAVARSV